MGENSTHPDYDVAAAEWSQARDVLVGEDAVKAAGENYLPRLDSQSEEEYAAYRARASFFRGTAHTLEEHLDLILRPGSDLGSPRSPLASMRVNSRFFLPSKIPNKFFLNKKDSPTKKLSHWHRARFFA